MFELIPFERHMNRVMNYDPFHELEEMQRSFFNESGRLGFRTDVCDTGDAYRLESELPGFRKEDITIDIENDCLTIKAERKADNEDKKDNYLRRERVYGSYSRSFDVSGVNVDAISASYTDGILSVTLPKKPEITPPSRRLEIQ